MTLLIDTGALVAAADLEDPHSEDVQRILASTTRALVVPEPITGEADYVLGRRVGRAARLALLDDIAAGHLLVEGLTRSEHATVAALERRYADFDLGLADLSLVVLAERFRTRDLVTLDERHFRAIEPLQGGAFRLLPADG